MGVERLDRQVVYAATTFAFSSGLRQTGSVVPCAKGIHEWELEILAKGLILHALEVGDYDFRTWNVLANAPNKLKDLKNQIAERYGRLICGAPGRS